MGNEGREGGERGPLPGWAPPPVPGGDPRAAWRPDGSWPPGPPGGPVQPPWGAPRPPKRFGAGALVGTGIAGVVLGGVLSFVGLVVIALVVGDDVAHPAVGTYGPVGETAGRPSTGDCLSARPRLADLSDDDEVVPCAERHDAEVIGTTEIPASDRRPGDDALDAFVSEACALAFRSYTGDDPETTTLDIGAVVPDRAAWTAGERRIWCLVDSSGANDGVGSIRRVS